MNKLLVFLGAFFICFGSQLTSAQVGSVVDTTALQCEPMKPKAIPQQENGLSDGVTLADYESAYKRGIIPMLCEVMPAYIKRNKKDSLPRFIQENLHWPAIGLRMDIGGKEFVSFMVGTDGNVYHTKILKSLHPDFDAEALRAVQLLSGRFSPAVCGGVARPHEMVVPVSFFLN